MRKSNVALRLQASLDQLPRPKTEPPQNRAVTTGSGPHSTAEHYWFSPQSRVFYLAVCRFGNGEEGTCERFREPGLSRQLSGCSL